MIQVWLFDGNYYFTRSIKVEKVTDNMTIVPCNTNPNNNFYKPKWTGDKWVEGWTEEEIDAWNKTNKIDICPEKTTEEKLEKLTQYFYDLVEIVEDVIGGNE